MNFYLAQIIGFVGFLVIFASIYSKEKKRLLIIDLIGCLIIGLHWLLLGAISAVALNLILAGAAGFALLSSPLLVRRGALMSILASCLVLVIFWQGWIDLFALIATIALIEGKVRENMRDLRALMILASVSWIFYGLYYHSFVQIGFALVTILIHFFCLYRDRETLTTPLLTPAPKIPS